MGIKVLYWLWKYRMNKDGLSPLYCRISNKNDQVQFSMEIYLKSEQWNSHKQIIVSHTTKEFFNQCLQKNKLEILNKYYILKLATQNVDINALRKSVKNNNTERCQDIGSLTDKYLKHVQNLVDKDYDIKTFYKYRRSLNLITSALGPSFKLSELNTPNLDFLYSELRVKYKISTINKIVKIFKQLINYAFQNGFLDKNPFAGYKLKHEKKAINYLNIEEVNSILNCAPKTTTLEHIKDSFIFSCYTGLAYNEAREFKFDNIYYDKESIPWALIGRKKTGKSYEIPILPQACIIIEKYKKRGFNQLPLISNQKFNKYIKELCLEIGIKKDVSHHLARKTFATTILLESGIPMEIVSNLLGHSNCAITSSSYAAITKSQIKSHLNFIK